MKSVTEVQLALCDRIQARIEHFGLTQVEAANLAGVQQSMISRIKNKRPENGIDGLVSILSRLGEDVRFDIVTTKSNWKLPASLRGPVDHA